MRRLAAVACLTVTISGAAQAQQLDVASAMHWRSIGPTRAGRARAATGFPGSATRPAAFYAGFDNGGVWRSTDYGANWVPLFDQQATGSIGAIAVAPSNPDVIYVGSGAGIIRPDLATGNGMYKSTDGGRTWTHIGLDDTKMIAYVDVDPTNPDRVFVAALGHPYGPNTERGIFRTTDGGQHWDKVLYKDEYTGGNDVRIDPSNPQVVYAALWCQQQAFWEGGSFDGTAEGVGGIYKSTDGGTTWTQLGGGLPNVMEADIAISPSGRTLYSTIAVLNPQGGPVVGMWKSTDAGATWTLRTLSRRTQDAGSATVDGRPMTRIGGGDLPPVTIDPGNENVVYTASTVMWRSEDGGTTWSAVRGAPGGDDYQRVWVSPADPNIVFVVADQGAVVSANRGMSWSNWYNQSTAAVYHTTTDNAFPYRVCSGQQDSGSLCVASRSDDGEITFHDWHPVNIQEYGMAAPDPRDPDLVFGSARTNVSLYNRRTGTTTLVGPGGDQRGADFGRNVRTMPLIWRGDVLYYASNVVWKSVDRAHTWTRISGDLTRGANWTAPASAGRYAQGLQVTARGAITALSPSSKSALVIWAGSDDGTISVTTNGGTSWRNVTPDAISAWTRIYNIEAGHFDTQTAYAAANTLRIDDYHAHFFKTHDGGATWTEISNGITDVAPANSIREDPRVAGLLYAATDNQVWVSFDDGANWQSLRGNMPAISVRDLEVKDDSSCGCADLVAGTHGRGFWILDNLTPLRQQAAIVQARADNHPFLVKPLAALRVRFGTNEPTPWPPELPAGENPPDGAIIDYFLPGEAPTVRLEILDAAGRVVRSYASNDPTLSPDPGVTPQLYDHYCQQNPGAADCGLPLYWPAPQERLGTSAGMHRFAWNMRLQPVAETNPAAPGAEVDATGAVPHRSQLPDQAPWAAPGRYTVRLIAGSDSLTQPIAVKLDPRVRITPVALAQLNSLTREMYDKAVQAAGAITQARALSESATGERKAALDSIAPPPRQGGGRRFGGGGGGFGNNNGPQPVTLESARNALMAAAMSMQNAEAAPTAAQVAACAKARQQFAVVWARWMSLKGR